MYLRNKGIKEWRIFYKLVKVQIDVQIYKNLSLLSLCRRNDEIKKQFSKNYRTIKSKETISMRKNKNIFILQSWDNILYSIVTLQLGNCP